MIALVLSVIAASINSGSKFQELVSISVNFGTAPVNNIELDVAIKVNGVVITSSPGFMGCFHS